MPRRLAELCLVVIATAKLSACGLLAPQAAEPPRASPAPRPASSAGEVIEFANELRALDDAELEQLHRELTLHSQREPSSGSALRLALLLSYPDSAHYDLDRAINLLNQIARTRRDEDPAYPSLAELLATILIERKTITTDRASLREQIAVNNDRLEALRSELDETRIALAEEQQRSEELQSQLDALIELEEQLNGQTAGAADGQ